MTNILELPKSLHLMTDEELEAERIRLLSEDIDNYRRYVNLVHEIVKRMHRHE